MSDEEEGVWLVAPENGWVMAGFKLACGMFLFGVTLSIVSFLVSLLFWVGLLAVGLLAI